MTKRTKGSKPKEPISRGGTTRDKDGDRPSYAMTKTLAAAIDDTGFSKLPVTTSRE